MKRTSTAALLALIAAVALASSSWEGSAMMSAYGEFPSSGYYAACNSFPRNTAVEVRNLDSGRSITVIVTKGVANAGIFMVLSPEAALALGIEAGAVASVGVSEPRSLAEIAPPASRGETADPDFNPALLAKRAADEAAARSGAKPATKPAEATTEVPLAALADKPPETKPAEAKPSALAATSPEALVKPRGEPVESVAATPLGEPAVPALATPVPSTAATLPKPDGAPLSIPPEVKPTARAEALPRPELLVRSGGRAGAAEPRVALADASLDLPPVERASIYDFSRPARAGLASSYELVDPKLVFAPEDRAFILALERASKEGVAVAAQLLDPRFGLTAEELALVMTMEGPGKEAQVAAATLMDPPYDLPPSELAFAHAIIRAAREGGAPAVYLYDPELRAGDYALALGVERPERLPLEFAAVLAEPGLGPELLPGLHERLASPAMSVPEIALDEGTIRIDEAELASAFSAPPLPPRERGELAMALDEPYSPGEAAPPPLVSAPTPGATESGAVIVSIEPSSPRPPSAATKPAGSAPAASVGAPSGLAFVAALDKGAFYIQLGAFNSQDALKLAAVSVAGLGPLVAEESGKGAKRSWRLFLGPLGRDESGVALLRAKALGFRDAFLKRGS